jgi:hypothetical protein
MGLAGVFQSVRFDESRTYATDEIWYRQLEARYGSGTTARRAQPYFFALWHGENMSRHIGRWDYNRPRCELAKLCGEQWGETGRELDALLARLDAGGRGV